MTDHLETGKAGEDRAQVYMRNKGYTLIERNWRFRKAEIDLIFTNENYVVFVEVKTRTGQNEAEALRAIGKKKQRLLLSAADAYMQDFEGSQKEARFDVMVISGHSGNWDINHIEDAFRPRF